jgi:hypothetical protein
MHHSVDSCFTFRSYRKQSSRHTDLHGSLPCPSCRGVAGRVRAACILPLGGRLSRASRAASTSSGRSCRVKGRTSRAPPDQRTRDNAISNSGDKSIFDTLSSISSLRRFSSRLLREETNKKAGFPLRGDRRWRKHHQRQRFGDPRFSQSSIRPSFLGAFRRPWRPGQNDPK